MAWVGAAERPSVQAIPLAENIIHVDGDLSESIWESAMTYPRFTQRNPDEGLPATENTGFAVLFDSQNLYVGIIAHTDDPSQIRKILSRRDARIPSDWLYVSLDSYNDNRTAFEFGLNPMGVKRDLRRYDDENLDLNWDAIWEGKASLTDGGWSVEFKIPFRELRFAEQDHAVWGLQIYRYIAVKNEEDYWSFWSKEESGQVRHYGELNGLDNIALQNNIQISPYVTGSYDSFEGYVNPVHPQDYNILSTFGADIKYGITNNLTLDISLNPDFGQVEADPAELNISSFESFFEEKRPLFVEGGNIFNFALGFGDGDDGRNTLFYSRRIGRMPHDYASSQDLVYYATNPKATRIHGAAKISGKTANGFSIGILDAVTAKETAEIKYMDGTSDSYTVEPLTNYFVGRLQKDFQEGQTTMGGMITATNRNLEADHLKWLHRDAYAIGFDANHRFYNNQFLIMASFSATQVAGHPDAMRETQSSSIHYFQRPDATHLTLDTTRTMLRGYAHTFLLTKIQGDWRGGVGEWTFSPGFEANDLGYHRDVDSKIRFLWINYRENDPGQVVRRYNINHNIWYGETFDHERLALGGNLNGNMTLMNYWRLGGGLNIEGPAYHRTALWGGPKVMNDPSVNGWFFIGSDNRDEINIAVNGWKGRNRNGSYWHGLFSDIEWQATDYLSLVLSGSVNQSFDTWSSWYDYSASIDQETGEKTYILADMIQNTLQTTLRVDYTITANLTLQFYGQPFVTAGRYDGFKALVDPEATEFSDRYLSFNEAQLRFNETSNVWEIDSDLNTVPNYIIDNYDFNYKAFNSNLVLRWEFKPGSLFYLVWSRGMTDYISDGSYYGLRDLQRIFRRPTNDVLLVKYNYLFNL